MVYNLAAAGDSFWALTKGRVVGGVQLKRPVGEHRFGVSEHPLATPIPTVTSIRHPAGASHTRLPPATEHLRPAPCSLTLTLIPVLSPLLSLVPNSVFPAPPPPPCQELSRALDDTDACVMGAAMQVGWAGGWEAGR